MVATSFPTRIAQKLTRGVHVAALTLRVDYQQSHGVWGLWAIGAVQGLENWRWARLGVNLGTRNS